MDYNLKSLVKRVKDALNDAEFSDDLIKQYLNDAQNEVLGESKYSFMRKIDEDSVRGIDAVMLPLDHQATENVIVRQEATRRELDYVPTGEAGHFTYSIFGNDLVVRVPHVPKPRGSWYIKHYYLAKPLPMIDDEDVPHIPEEFGEILVLGALVRAEKRRDNFDFAADYANAQRSLVENMRLRYATRNASFGSRARLPIRRMG
jgi:hypothetical protein